MKSDQKAENLEALVVRGKIKDQTELKKEFHRLAFELHPDTSGFNHDMFIRLRQDFERAKGILQLFLRKELHRKQENSVELFQIPFGYANLDMFERLSFLAYVSLDLGLKRKLLLEFLERINEFDSELGSALEWFFYEFELQDHRDYNIQESERCFVFGYKNAIEYFQRRDPKNKTIGISFLEEFLERKQAMPSKVAIAKRRMATWLLDELNRANAHSAT